MKSHKTLVVVRAVLAWPPAEVAAVDRSDDPGPADRPPHDAARVERHHEHVERLGGFQKKENRDYMTAAVLLSFRQKLLGPGS